MVDDIAQELEKDAETILAEEKRQSRIFWLFMFLALIFLTAASVWYALSTGHSLFELK